MQIGTANYSSGSKRTSVKWLKLKDGANVFRILPPIGSLAERGVWARYLKIEWGYKDTKGIHKPFQDCRVVNGKTKMIEVESYAHLHREELKAEKTRIIDAFKAGKATKDQLQEINDKVMAFNQDSKFYVNVIGSDGQMGVLKVPYKAKQALDAEIKKLNAAGVDPLSVEDGRFFNFFRSGEKLETQYQVTVYKERVETKEYGMVEKDIVHKLTSDIVNRLQTEVLDLADLDKMYPKLSSEDVQSIVEGGPQSVDEVFARVKPKKEEVIAAQAAAPAIEEEEPEAESTYTPPTSAAPKAADAPKKAAAPASKPAAKAATPPPSAGETDEDFLRKMGVL